MHIRCPHCNNPIEILDNASLSDLYCPSCGSGFNILGDETIKVEGITGDTIGHFMLKEKLGIGAFGTVWKAIDTELDRTVAIKIPRKDQLDAEESEKFLREARAAAQLKHPNIVSVHEVGRDNEQIYIVSDYIAGITLADWLSGQQPTPNETAELCKKIAVALHHAHQQGVIHRDLKPGNVMLDKEGEPHIMDFGLAKRETGEITMTVDGKILGTPAYMSPEQALGEGHDADARSDIYSLGVILYELLTGEKPFRGNQRMLLHQVLNEEPKTLQLLRDHIPRDLETITLKCMEKEPARRYGSAQLLAEELSRFLEGHPILARPVSRVAKLYRWSRRNPLVAALTSTAVLLLIAVAVVGMVGYVQTSRALERESEQRKLAQHQGELAEENLQKARGAVEEYFTTVSESKLLNVPGLQPLRKEPLESALRYYQGFIEQHRDDAAVQEELAAAYHRVGNITYKIGSEKDAFRAHRTALELREKLATGEPTNIGYQNDLAASFRAVGFLQSNTGRKSEALASYKKAIEIREKLAAENPHVADYRLRLALGYSNRGTLQSGMGKRDEALTSYQNAIGILEKLTAENAVTEFRNHLASIYNNLGIVQEKTSRLRDAVVSHQKAIQIKKKLVVEYPDVIGYRGSLANSFNSLGIVQEATNNFSEALVTYKNAIEIQEKLATENPAVIKYRDELADSYYNVGMVQWKISKLKDADRRVQKLCRAC